MTHAWNQSISIDEKKAKQLIESQHHIPIKMFRLLDEGWDNLVYLVNETIIFRFPKREPGLTCIENEIALLPYIASQVSFPLSSPKWIGKPTDLYPYPFAGYPMIPGKPVSDTTPSLIADTEFAIKLASWLGELHSLPVKEEHLSLIKGDQRWRYDVNHRVLQCTEKLIQYENYFLQSGFDKAILLEIIALLPSLVFQENKKSYLHADLYSRHVVVNPQTFTPSGLIDWGDMHIGHPGIDLAVGMIFTEETFQVFLNTYGAIDDGTVNLLLFHSFCHHMSFLPYTCEQNKDNLKKWAAMVLARAISEIKKRALSI
ncbi:MAG: phosphotransferase [Legionella sp.]|nr:phosphotransferase [Legionella sp.]